MKSNNEKVLLFGADSFTGHYLQVELREAGYSVYGTVLSKPSHDNLFYCDIRNKQDVISVFNKIRPDYIIHLAALSYTAENDIHLYYNTNLLGTINIFESLKQLNIKPKKIIFPSTAAVYGNSESLKISENQCPNPISHYAVSKYAAEQIIKGYYSDFSVTITRPFNYTGVGQSDRFIIPKIVSHIKSKKKSIELGNMNVFRDFSDVRDIVRAYRILLNCDRCFEIINLCSSEFVEIMEIVNYCSKVTGHFIEVMINDHFVRKNDIVRLCGDNSLLKTCGYSPHYSIYDTLDWMLQ